MEFKFNDFETFIILYLFCFAMCFKDYIDSALKTALQIHKYSDDGDVLVFLPGQDEIEDVASLLKKHLEEMEPDDSRDTSKDIVQDIKGIGTSISSGNTMIVNGVLICVLYAALPPEAQMNAFRPKPEGCVRKIILSTNIAGEYVYCNFSLLGMYSFVMS